MQKEHKTNVSNYRKIKNIIKTLDEDDHEKPEKNKMLVTPVNKVSIKREKNGGINADDVSKSTTGDKTDNDSKQDIIKETPVYVCAICDKKFNNKYIMARHLLSTYHKNIFLQYLHSAS
jgi:hypothetical protein